MSPRIAYVVKVYPRLSETFIVNEILALEAQGADVSVYSLNPPKDGRFHERLGRVRASVTYLPAMGQAQLLETATEDAALLAPHREMLGRHVWSALESGDLSALRTLGKGLALARELRAAPVDHIHAHFATSAAEAAGIAATLTGLPFSFTAHAKDIYVHDYVDQALRERLEAARFCVTVCDANAAYLRDLAPQARIERVYNGLDLEEFAVPDLSGRSSATILSVGRLVPKKGLDTLLLACAELARRGVPFRCDLAGTGPEEAALRAMIADLELEPRVRLLGAISNEEARRRMGGAAVFALPARITDDGNRDALPTVLLEALATGTPVVSTPVTGIPEIVGEDEAGRLVPPDDPERLADALQELLASTDDRALYGRRGRARAERLFNGAHSARRLLDLFTGTATPAPQPSQVLDAAALR
ncbi:MAG: glycosyltransferase [Gemmatimonadetes bacterium]|nr:glycosyltransferase [Gemmatimonadota bacterium]